MGCCLFKKEEEEGLKEIEHFLDKDIISTNEDLKYKQLTDGLLLKEVPLFKYCDQLLKFESKNLEEKYCKQYNYNELSTVVFERINKKQFSNFIDVLLKDVSGTPEKKKETKENLELMYERILQFGLTDISEEEKRKKGIDKYLLLAFGFLYCGARRIDKISNFFDFFKSGEDNLLKFKSEVDSIYQIILVLATFGETSCVMKDNKIDFVKFIDNSLENLSDEQKTIINYAKRFCVTKHISNLQSKISYLHFCFNFNEITEKQNEIAPKIEKGIDKQTYISLFEKKEIPIFYFSSFYVRKYIVDTFIAPVEEEN